MTQQQQQYYYWQMHRRQAMLRLYNNKVAMIRNIRSMLARGVNPADDPEIAETYFALIGEFGEGIFRLEDQCGILTKEESKNV